jgi:hypothetical protein
MRRTTPATVNSWENSNCRDSGRHLMTAIVAVFVSKTCFDVTKARALLGFKDSESVILFMA